MEQSNAGSQATPFVEEGQGFDPRAYWGVVVRRRWLIIPFFVAVVLVVMLITLRQTPMFAATCTLVVEPAAPRILDQSQVQEMMDSGPIGYAYSRDYMETQVKIINSRTVAQRVVDQVGDVDQTRDPVGALQAGIKVEQVPSTRLLKIRVEARAPDRAALLANAVAEAYITESLAVKSSATQNASEWLETQLADLEKKLGASSRALFEFKKAHEIVATSWEDRQSIVSQRVTAINEALTKARVDRADIQAKAEGVEALSKNLDAFDTEAGSTPAVASNALVQSLKTEYFRLRSDCADTETRYLPDHPRVQTCKARLAATELSLKNEIRTVLNAARREQEQVQRKERNLNALLEQTKSDAFALNQYEREYNELKRSHENNQRLYDVLLKGVKDASVRGMLNVSNVRILDRARPSNTPVRPRVRESLFLALALGLLGGIALAFAAEFLDTSITSQQQVEERLGATFLGVVPRIARGKEGVSQDLIVSEQPKSAVAECLRAVRTNLLFMSPERPLKTLLVTSAAPQEGKTTSAATLAQIMADGGSRVLLVDADMRRPRIHRIFGLSSNKGLSSLILGEGTLDEVVQQTRVANLSVLPCGPVPPNPAELLHTDAFAKLLVQMAGKFDRVIMDSPPVGIVADATIMSTQVDGTVLVIKAGQTSRYLARQALRAISDVNARLFGAILNDVDLDDRRYGQYAYYRYGYYYGDGRTEANQAS